MNTFISIAEDVSMESDAEKIACSPTATSTARSPLEAMTSVLALSLACTLLLARRPVSGPADSIKAAISIRDLQTESVPAALPVIEPLTGTEKRYVVTHDTALLSIARAQNTDEETLARLNGLTGNRARRGQILRLPSQTILPLKVRDGLVLNIPERGVYVFRNDLFLGRYPVAVGMRTWETPIGQFRLVRKVVNPTWIPPRVMIEREGISSADVPPGDANNPLGDRWMGWSAPEVGFHSTFAVQTVGRLASHACVRMYPESAHHLYNLTYLGMPIYSVYEPIKIGRVGHDIYLSLSPDVYHLGKLSLRQVQKRLKQNGVWEGVDWAQVRQMLIRQDGYPRRIARLKSASQGNDENSY